MGAGTGVTATKTGDDRWRVRWRERQPDGGWSSKGFTLRGSKLDRDRMIVEVREALVATGTFELITASFREPANLLEGMLEMIRQRAASGKYAGKTPDTYRSYTLRVVEHIHRLRKIPSDEEVPVTVLSRDLFNDINVRDSKVGSSDSTRYGSVRLLLDAWEWMYDDRVRWAHVPEPPRRGARKDYLPRTAAYSATVAPTMSEMDACLRHFPPTTSRATVVMGVLLRMTGLRGAQVMAIHGEDIDLEAGELSVRGGRSRAEKTEGRTVPLAPALLEDTMFRAWVEAHPTGPLFPKRRYAGATPGGRTKLPVVTFGQAWASSGVSRRVWAPPSRRYTRPEHAFRAGFQAFLRDRGVAGDVIDFLVGHHPTSVRDVHYGRELIRHAREAVAHLEPVSWDDETPDSNVVPFRRRA